MQTRANRQRDERGAELVEFAFVVVLLITLLYGIVTFGLILAAQSSLTQAAADAARAGIIKSSGSAAATAADNQVNDDLGWMGKGTCGTSSTSTTVITCVATPEQCPSSSTNQCLQVVVTYHYNQSPLLPEMPGLGVIIPSTLSSTNVLQMSTPSS